MAGKGGGGSRGLQRKGMEEMVTGSCKRKMKGGKESMFEVKAINFGVLERKRHSRRKTQRREKQGMATRRKQRGTLNSSVNVEIEGGRKVACVSERSKVSCIQDFVSSSPTTIRKVNDSRHPE